MYIPLQDRMPKHPMLLFKYDSSMFLAYGVLLDSNTINYFILTMIEYLLYAFAYHFYVSTLVGDYLIAT